MNIMNKKYVAAGAVALGAVGVLGVTGAFAAEEAGTFTGLKGIEHTLIAMTAEIIGVDDREVVLKDSETGDEYTTRIPGKTGVELEEGVTAKVEGFEVDPEHATLHPEMTFKVTSVDGEELKRGGQMMREKFANMSEEERAEFRAQVEEKKGKMQMHQFADADGDGQCDHMK